jgi:hypothetical protein
MAEEIEYSDTVFVGAIDYYMQVRNKIPGQILHDHFIGSSSSIYGFPPIVNNRLPTKGLFYLEKALGPFW